MKKILLILVILTLLVPATALAATEFSLGGFIKLSTFWDSTQNPYTPTSAISRNNDALFHHGNFNMSAQESRFNFTIKGPKLWGATTTGFIEMDFDALGDENASSLSGAPGTPGSTSAYQPRLRHAMFRLNWPETELMFGQYWGMLSEFAPEGTGDSQLTSHGFVNQRQPQIRLTQKFLGDWTVAGAVMKPYDPSSSEANFAGAVPAGSFGSELPGGLVANTATGALGVTGGEEGRSTEVPQLQGKLAYEKDLWGKAPFYGRPRGFTAQVTAAWQRLRFRNNVTASNLNTFGQNAFGQAAVTQQNQQYLDPWIVEGVLFVPVLPTYSNNLAGSASLTAQWFVGQGVSFVGAARDNDASVLMFQGRNPAGTFMYDRSLMNQYGGYVQGQYWFTNQWFLNVAWGMIRDFGISQSRSLAAVTAANPAGYMYASNNDQVKLWQEIDLTLWYRPIESLKFGLQYAYERTDFLQKLNDPVLPPATNQTTNQASAGAKDAGDAHRINFVAQFFF